MAKLRTNLYILYKVVIVGVSISEIFLKLSLLYNI